MKLLDEETLERSAVVANCAMNRARRLTGGNGYERELGLQPLTLLGQRLRTRRSAGWLDLCCGEGRAQLEAAEALAAEGLLGRVRLVGVDLVAQFAPAPAELPGLQRVEESVHRYEPQGRFDLITCVHGLHYLGDKLGVLARAAGWLERGGLLLANLDLANLRDEQGAPLGRRALAALRAAGFTYDRHRRLLGLRGPRSVSLPFEFLGSDDHVGPNCTGQPAVDARYRVLTARAG